ncbi:hypothetical protein HNP69_000490 [Chryseobacterium koreense]|nr:hypothetical protein [Chryseobacterium koreense]
MNSGYILQHINIKKNQLISLYVVFHFGKIIKNPESLENILGL